MTTITASFLHRLGSGMLASAVALVLAAGLLGAQASAAEGWLTSYDEAIAAAKKTGRPIVANFTGSDWCGWCIRLKDEVFETKDFKEWASANAILLEVDFPQQKAQDAATKAKNQQLSQQHGIQGYPTILILDAAGKKTGELGYMQGGPKVWLAEFVKQYKGGGKK